MKTVKTQSDMKVGESTFAVLEFIGVYIPGEPGDERSRTHPGHGYPATPGHTEKHAQLITFDSQAELEEWVAQKSAPSRWGEAASFIVLNATRLGVETKTTISIK